MKLFKIFSKKSDFETEIEEYSKASEKRKTTLNNGDRFEMIIQDVFIITGRGIVATGQVSEGALSVGDDIIVKRHGKEDVHTRVKGIEGFRKVINEAKKGDNIGILFAGTINREEVKRGDKVIK